jgi:hypothetical protein
LWKMIFFPLFNITTFYAVKMVKFTVQLPDHELFNVSSRVFCWTF